MFADTILGMGRTSIFESAIDDEIASISIDTVEECAGDPFEFLTAAYYESDMNMMKINQAIMVCEYAYLKENGTEMVYESNVVTSMFRNIGEGIKKAWRKICEFFKSIFSWLENAIRSDKKFVEKYEKKIKDITGSVNIGDFKGYSYSTSASKYSDNPAVADVASKMMGDIKGTAISVKDLANGEITKDTNAEEYVAGIREKALGEKCDKSDFPKKLTELFRGAELNQKEFSKSDLESYLEVVKNAKSTKAGLKATYSAAKGAVDGLLKAVKALEKKAAADDGKKASESDNAKAYHVAGTIINSCTNMLTMINNKAGKALTAHNRQCKAIVTKAVNKFNSNSDKKDDESGVEVQHNSASLVDQVFESFLG